MKCFFFLNEVFLKPIFPLHIKKTNLILTFKPETENAMGGVGIHFLCVFGCLTPICPLEREF